MSIRFIYGRAGSGKTSFCLKDIKDRLKDDDNRPLILLVPEMFTFETEKLLLKTIDKDINMRAQVLSFKTLANRVFSEVGGLTHKHMKSCGRAMLIYRVIERVKKELKIFSKSSNQQGFVDIISDMITELKRFEISPDFLKQAIENVENSLLKEKLEDITLIFSEFEEKLHEKYIDSEDEMTMLYKKLEKSTQFNGAEIWIDGFSGFTPQQYKVIEMLLKKSYRVNVTLTTDTLCKGMGIDRTEVFAPVKNTEEKLLKICQDNNTAYEEPVNLNDGNPVRFKESQELQHLEGYIYSFPYKEYPEKTEDIEIFTAVNIYSEVEETARDIVRFIRKNNLRFSDITIAARDMDRYENLIGAIFSEYNIPYFISQKRDIKNNPIIVLINSALDIYSKKWSYESVFRYLKTGLIEIDRNDINLLENYVLANGIKGLKWFEEEWEYRLDYRFDKADMSDYERETIKRVNGIKNIITKPLAEFHKKLSGKHTVTEICTTLYEFLVKIRVPEKITELINYFKENKELDIANQYSQVWDIVVNVLDQMVEVLGDEELTIDKFIKVLSIGFDEYEIGLVPPAIDQVLVTSVDRMKSHNSKVLYILGVNDGVFPAAITDEGILNDSDREALREIGIELDHDARTKAFEEQFLIYTSLTSSRKKLRISYPIADHEGRTMRPSIIISRVKKIFPRVKQKSNIVKSDTSEENLNLISTAVPTFNEMITAIKRWEDTKAIDPMWLDAYRWYVKQDDWKDKTKRILEGLYYTNQVTKVNNEKLRELYGNKIYLNISRLEKYSECPFAYFIQYGLKARERKIYGFTAPDIGTFMHNVLDEFSAALEKEGLTWREIEKDWVKDAVSIIVDNMIEKIPGFILNSSPRYKYLAERLKRILSSAVWIIAEHIKRSSFEPIGHEIGFGNGEKYPPIKIELPTGEEINLIGRIDRVDLMEKNGEGYIRIVDYKSGNKNLNLTEIYYGLQLQLLIYLDAILESAQEGSIKLNPAGILYFKIDDPIIKTKGNMEDEEIEKEILKKLKMRGFVLKDADIIREMDKSINGTSLIIPASVNKDGNLGSRTQGATEEEFLILRSYVKTKIKEICEDMIKGNIMIRPYKKKKQTPCEYCRFTSICQFDSSIKDNDYRIINDKDEDEIWKLFKQGVESNE
ncbi:ATP-dependent helicase [Fervidicella metallireducens AeB]|uniref:ATP-dependent helicase/deoxyribonuclease subunit B n=1 Tax=Fervidicella metallireducens AeB TaxID=1403537 RepID=A0A017RWF4_9CLOT|nr:helicase-exonuclease AddAB subunit AddB [Fervidicella metallireducens]EYE88734.1 ATP-dependent helicase [Fervidicella metallireducens AeB]